MNDTPQYTVRPYLHGAELLMPDGTPTGFFANRLYGQKDGVRRAEVLAEALNERIELAAERDAAADENARLHDEVARLEARVAELERTPLSMTVGDVERLKEELKEAANG